MLGRVSSIRGRYRVSDYRSFRILRSSTKKVRVRSERGKLPMHSDSSLCTGTTATRLSRTASCENAEITQRRRLNATSRRLMENSMRGTVLYCTVGRSLTTVLSKLAAFCLAVSFDLRQFARIEPTRSKDHRSGPRGRQNALSACKPVNAG